MTGCVAMALTSAACRGSGDDGERSATPASAATEIIAPTVEATSAAELDATAAAGLDELRVVAERFGAATFSATYESRAGAPLRFEIRKDLRRFRLDVSGEREGAPFSAITIIGGSGSFACFTGAQAEAFGQSPDGVCAEVTNDAENPLTGVLAAFTVTEATRLLETGQRQIAGREATCYRTSNAGIEGTACFDPAGVLLAIESTDAGGINLVAVQVADTVRDADFLPPFEVKAIPGFGG
jgi:hypothetical protein